MKLIPSMGLLFFAASCSVQSQTFDPHDVHSPLRLIRKIELPQVRGRIDHLALDEQGNHLFVAEYGNGSVDEVDLASGTLVGRITGLHEPQGVAWLAKQKEIAVASGDGFVTFYRGLDRQKVAVVRLGDDADDIRVDGSNGRLVVGYGSGGLAVIDPARHAVVGELKLPAHPEAFELIGSAVFVNVPDRHEILIGDLARGQVSTAVSTGARFGNFPMAADANASQVAVAFRMPAALSVLDARSGATIFSTAVCGDADDLYFHVNAWVVICGSGAVELVDDSKSHSKVVVTTARGARTGLLDASQAKLYVAVPAHDGPAAIWELSFR